MQEIDGDFLKYDFEKLFASSYKINCDFDDIWANITKNLDNVGITIEEARDFMKELVIYDALDGGRTTLTSNDSIEPQDDIPLFSVGLIHTLQSLGAKSCVIMLHTSYNRKRGNEEIKRILDIIRSGAELIKQYSKDNNIRCNCLCMNDDYEMIEIIKDVEKQTQNGRFNAYFLFDYNENWSSTKKGQEILRKLPEINVHIRHTKFNFSGGWIPEKMCRSSFLYSQNGTKYSNWESDEIVALVAMALLSKKLNEGEALSKMYVEPEEIENRYFMREIDLFLKRICFREKTKKLFMLGSPVGIYEIYY